MLNLIVRKQNKEKEHNIHKKSVKTTTEKINVRLLIKILFVNNL